MAGRHHTATISPDLIQQLFQVKYEDDERKKAAEEAEAEGDANGSPGGGGGANIRSGAPKKLNIKEEAVVASAEVVRMFVADSCTGPRRVRWKTGRIPWTGRTWRGCYRSSSWTTPRNLF